MADGSCYLCGKAAQIYEDLTRGFYEIRCQTCGYYHVDRRSAGDVRSADERTRAAVSAATRQASETRSLLRLEMTNWEQIAADHLNTPVRQKVAKLLQYLAAKSKYPGDPVRIDSESDYPTCDAVTESECEFLIEHLKDRDYVHLGAGPTFPTLTVMGWEQVQPPAGPAGVPGRCFVAMSFADELDEAYLLGIKPAVEQDCGMNAIRMKELHHNQDICDRLLSEIRQAQFVIADFTGHRNGVYYEAGFARALGREVINCCRADCFDELHFDTNHLNHIKWTAPADLREKLTHRIRATILKP